MKTRRAVRVHSYYLADIAARKELDLLKDEVQMLIQERFLSIANFAYQKNLTELQYTWYRHKLNKRLHINTITHNNLIRVKQDILKYPKTRYYPRFSVIKKIREMIAHINYYSKDNLYLMKFGDKNKNIADSAYVYNRRINKILNSIEKSLIKKSQKGVYVFPVNRNCNLYQYRDLMMLLEKDVFMKRELDKVIARSRIGFNNKTK